MNLADLYPAVLLLVLIGILLGVGLTVLAQLGNSAGISTAANTSIQNTITAIGNFPTWFTIIVVILAAAVIIGVVMKSFGGQGGR